MNASSRRRPPAVEPAVRADAASWITSRRAGLGGIAVAVAACGAIWMAWARYGDAARGHPDTLLFPEAVELRGRPEWVPEDLRTEALRDASLDGGLPLDDPQLPQRLKRAFEMHPWVAEVRSVAVRQPAAAVVEVRCREPVAMVRVPGGLLAVDAEGIVLPSADFAADTAAVYPRVAGIQSSPLGAEGSRWGDAAVHEAAALAAAIGPEWRALGLQELRSTATRGGRHWELAADEGGVTILFGSAPGREAEGEPAAAVKIGRLRALAAEAAQGADRPTQPRRIDLTVGAADGPTPLP